MFVTRSHGQGVVGDPTAPTADQAQTAAAAPGEDYFLEPLMRSFLLGVGAGAVVETTHVLFKAFSIAAATGPQVMDVLPGATAEFAPLFLWDHVAAL